MTPDVDFGPYRITRKTHRRPIFDTFEPHYTLEAGVVEDLRRIERADERLRSAVVDDMETRRLAEEALTRNAFGTASIEGNPLSLEEVESLLERGPTPEALHRPDEREILNYVAHMKRLPDRTLPTDADAVAALHGTLFDGVLRDAGRFKDQPNFIGDRSRMEVTFVPALPHRVRPELDRAMAWFQDAAEHPLVRTAVLFHEFQGIHPFRDGNGRTGRALATHQLYVLGYPGVRVALIDYEFNADREGYFGALVEVEANGYDFTPWVRYWLGVVRRTFEGALDRFTFQRSLPAEFNDRQVRLAQWFARLAQDSPHRRVKFADVHAIHPTIPERTLRRDLTRLVEVGVLEVQGQLKGTTYRLNQEDVEQMASVRRSLGSISGAYADQLDRHAEKFRDRFDRDAKRRLR